MDRIEVAAIFYYDSKHSEYSSDESDKMFAPYAKTLSDVFKNKYIALCGENTNILNEFKKILAYKTIPSSINELPLPQNFSNYSQARGIGSKLNDFCEKNRNCLEGIMENSEKGNLVLFCKRENKGLELFFPLNSIKSPKK